MMGSITVITLVMLLVRLRKFMVSCCLPLCLNLLPPALTNTRTLCLFAEQMQWERVEKPFRSVLLDQEEKAGRVLPWGCKRWSEQTGKLGESPIARAKALVTAVEPAWPPGAGRAGTGMQEGVRGWELGNTIIVPVI